LNAGQGQFMALLLEFGTAETPSDSHLQVSALLTGSGSSE
jgi:hypothetical protein